MEAAPQLTGRSALPFLSTPEFAGYCFSAIGEPIDFQSAILSTDVTNVNLQSPCRHQPTQDVGQAVLRNAQCFGDSSLSEGWRCDLVLTETTLFYQVKDDSLGDKQGFHPRDSDLD